MTPFLRTIAASVLGFVLLSGGPAVAQVPFESAYAPEDYRNYESSQYVAFEIKLGPYAPDLDAEFKDDPDGPRPFGDLFGGGGRVSVHLEVDWQIWDPFGSIGIGFAAGYYRASTQPFEDTGSTDSSPSTATNRVAGKTSITVAPLSLLAVYRFDEAADRWGVPLVPFVKAGLTYAMWRIANDSGTATFNGEKGRGASWGWQINAGLALQLDFLEPQAAKNLDVDLGINHTYLFAEFVHIKADGFGSSSKLNVGDTTVLGGLAFEM